MLLKILCDKDTYMLSEHVGVAEQTLKINGQCSWFKGSMRAPLRCRTLLSWSWVLRTWLKRRFWKFKMAKRANLLRTVIIGRESSWVPPNPKTMLPRYLIRSHHSRARYYVETLTSKEEAISSLGFLCPGQEKTPFWRTLPRKGLWQLPASKTWSVDKFVKKRKKMFFTSR